MKQRTITKPAAISFDTIRDDYLARGIDLYDVKGRHGGTMGAGNYEDWHKAQGLPDHDAEGKHFRSSKIFFKQYKDDENGEAKAPLFINVWHYLLDVSKPIKWTTTENEHKKAMPLCMAILPDLYEVTEEETANYKAYLKGFDEMTDEIIEEQVARNKESRLASIEARKILVDIINEYGTPDPEYDKILIIDMRVSR